jgi:hypothetical protein
MEKKFNNVNAISLLKFPVTQDILRELLVEGDCPE